MEAAFAPPWREASSVKSVSITLLTASHLGADTKNFVYFRTGGHKFLLADGDKPLAASLGPQVFELDLMSGPPAAADFRGFAVGMLAPAHPYGDAPDRWHPLRLVVGVNELITYDSEEYPFDRKSLQAIRVIPPAHLDQQSQLVVNDTHTPREVYVWEAGKALGLDPTDGSVLPIPDADTPDAPKAEPGLPEDPSEGGQFEDDEFGSDFPPFPGEPGDGGGGFGPPEGGDWPESPGGLGGGGWWPPPWWPLPGWPPGNGGGNGGGGNGGGGANPPPAGPTFAVKNVRVTSGWKSSEPFIVQWDISGDESQIKEYRVSLHEFQPDNAPFFGTELAFQAAAVGARTASLTTAGPIAGVHYFLPKVTALPTDPMLTPDFEWGPARPVFPPQTDPVQHRPHIFPMTFRYLTNANPNIPQSGPISIGSEPQGGRGVWTFGRQQSHIDFEFDDPSIGSGWNIAVRPDMNDQQLEFDLLNVLIDVGPPQPPQNYRILVYAGFVNGKDAVNSAKFSMPYTLERAVSSSSDIHHGCDDPSGRNQPRGRATSADEAYRVSAEYVEPGTGRLPAADHAAGGGGSGRSKSPTRPVRFTIDSGVTTAHLGRRPVA